MPLYKSCSIGQNSDILLPITEIKHKQVQWTLTSGTCQ